MSKNRVQTASCQTDVRRSDEIMTESQYRIYLDNLKSEICDLVNHSFSAGNDIEASWSAFRNQLKYWKKEHSKAYEMYLNSDDE